MGRSLGVPLGWARTQAPELSKLMTQHRHAPRGPLKAADPMGGADLMAVTCKAKSKTTGNRCKRPPIPGGAVCRYHGGAAPQVKNAAEARLRALEFPAIDRIGQLIQQTEFPSVAYQASKDVLDRLRGRATEFVEAKVTSITNLSDEELRAKALELAGVHGD